MDDGVTASIPDLPLAPFGWEAQWSWPHSHTSGEGVQVHVLIHTLSFIRACSGAIHMPAAYAAAKSSPLGTHCLQEVRWGERALGAVPSSLPALSTGEWGEAGGRGTSGQCYFSHRGCMQARVTHGLSLSPSFPALHLGPAPSMSQGNLLPYIDSEMKQLRD